MSSRPSSFIIAAVLSIYVLLHLVTLTRTPLAWRDEDFFASMTDSLSRQGTLHVLAEPITYPEPLLLYGPVYFLLSVPFERAFGVTQLMSRLPGLIFGLGVLGVIFAILRFRGVDRVISLLAISLFALDSRFGASLHQGRMETTALFFLLASFFLLLKSREVQGKAGLGVAAASGLLAAVGMLTTPRPGYLVIAMGLILVLRLFRDPPAAALARLAVWSGVIAALYLLWILAAFGGIGAFIAYYGRFARDYVGGTTFTPRQLPLIVVVIAPLIVLLWQNPRFFTDELLLFSVLGTAGYFALVRDLPGFGGTYSILMLPMTYMSIGLAISLAGRQQSSALKRLLQIGALVLLLINGATFVGRNLLVFAEWDERSPKIAENLAADIPPGSHVVGDEEFYFAVRRAGSDFQFFTSTTIDPRITIDQRASYHQRVYRADYLITTAGPESKALQSYTRQLGLVKVAGPPPEPPQGRLARFLLQGGRKLGFGSDVGYRGYRGIVYRTRNAQVTSSSELGRLPDR